MLSEVLKIGACTTPWLVGKGLRRVLLVDGTHLKCLGKDGKTWRIHTAFDLLAGRLTEAQPTDRHVGESWKLFDVQAGDLIVSDAINGYPERIGWIKDQQADALVRCSAHTSPLFDRHGHRLNLISWLKGRHAPTGRICEAQVSFHLAQERQLDVASGGLEANREATASRSKTQVQESEPKGQEEQAYG